MAVFYEDPRPPATPDWPDDYPATAERVEKLARALHAIAYGEVVCQFNDKAWRRADEDTQENYRADAREIVKNWPNLVPLDERIWE